MTKTPNPMPSFRWKLSTWHDAVEISCTRAWAQASESSTVNWWFGNPGKFGVLTLEDWRLEPDVWHHLIEEKYLKFKPSFSGSMLIFGGVPIRIPFIKGFQESKPPKPPTNWNLLIFCNITWKDASSKLSKSMQKSSSNQQNMFEQNVWSNLLASCF